MKSTCGPDEQCGASKPHDEKLPAHPIGRRLTAATVEGAAPQSGRAGTEARNPEHGKDELPP